MSTRCAVLCCLGLAACSSTLTTGTTADGGTGGAMDLSAVVVGDGGVAHRGDGGCTGSGAECQTNADCNDNDPTTTDTCVMSGGGEFPVGTCIHSACDGGVSCAMQAVDPGCNAADAGVVSPPFVTLHPPDVPSSCANGFQLTDARGAPNYVIHSKTAAGSRAITLDLDFATYVAPDGLLITGVDGECKQYILFSSCRIQTATQAEGSYTDGMHRPSDIAIRQFHLDLRPGTTQLTFDFSRVVSPMYVEVLGLCDFDLSTPATGVRWFALVP